jgi:hypothetical protein
LLEPIHCRRGVKSGVEFVDGGIRDLPGRSHDAIDATAAAVASIGDGNLLDAGVRSVVH